MKKILAGTTKQSTWVSSGITASPIYVALLDGSETVVSSTSMTSSGNGHYFGLITYPNTPGFYVVEDKATVATYPYKSRQTVKVVLSEVD